MGRQKTLNKLLHSKFFGLLVFTVVLVLLFYILEDKYITRNNIRMILISMTVPGVMLVSVAPLLIGGQIDLGAGAQATLGAMVFAQVLKFYPAVGWGTALVIALAAGVIFGLVNIFLVNKLGFMSFIATIGMSSVYAGLATMWTRTNEVPINNKSFTGLGKTALFDNWVPLLFIVMLVLVAIYGYVLSNTRFGRSVYMVGGNPYAARLSGLKPKKIHSALFINSSVFAVLAGITWSSYNKMASPTNLTTLAPNFAALTASILGGVSFMGGSGGMAGAFIALLLVNVFTSGLNIVHFPTYINTGLQGLILIVALVLDSVSIRRQRQMLMKAAITGGSEKAKA